MAFLAAKKGSSSGLEKVRFKDVSALFFSRSCSTALYSSYSLPSVDLSRRTFSSWEREAGWGQLRVTAAANISKVSALLCILHKITVHWTFERVCLDLSASRAALSRRVGREKLGWRDSASRALPHPATWTRVKKRPDPRQKRPTTLLQGKRDLIHGILLGTLLRKILGVLVAQPKREKERRNCRGMSKVTFSKVSALEYILNKVTIRGLLRMCSWI